MLFIVPLLPHPGYMRTENRICSEGLGVLSFFISLKNSSTLTFIGTVILPMSSDKRALDDLDAMFREVPDKAVSTLRPSKKLRHAQAKPKPSPADEDKSKKDQHITRRNISTDAGERKIPRGLLGALVPYKLNNSSCELRVDFRVRPVCSTCLYRVPQLSVVHLCLSLSLVCVFSSHLFWTSSILDVPAGVTQEESHTGFIIHLTSAVRALLFLARRIQPFLSLVDREVEFCV